MRLLSPPYRPTRLLAALRFALCSAWLFGAGWAWSQAVTPTKVPAAPQTAASEAPLEIEAKTLRSLTGDKMEADGPVTLRQGTLQLEADKLQIDMPQHQLRAQGHVTLRREGDRFSGESLQLNTVDYTGFFLTTQFHVARTQGSGSAERVDFLGPNRVAATRATYSSCSREDGDATLPWELTMRRLRIDVESNEGVAEGAVLRFYGVPILAAPVMTFPVTDERKSGWLPPQVSLSSNSGLEVAAPYYWSLAPNYDMTLTPTLSSRRGYGLGTEARYLFPRLSGEARVYVMPSDQLAQGNERWAARWRHQGAWDRGLFFDAQVLRVSDDAYWKDGLPNAESLTPRLLATNALFQQRRELRWNDVQMEQTLYAREQRWQSLQDVDPANRFVAPYRREPQIGARWRGLGSELDWSVQTEFNRFTHEDPSFIDGNRAHAAGSVAWPIGQDGWRLTPKLSFNAASYQYDKPLADGRTNASRLIPTVSVDNQWTFERQTKLFGQALTQTLEPRLMYLRTPFRNQLPLPSFDSAALDFNEVSVFADNSFSGIDRVSDANQVTAGATTRFISQDNGAELARIGWAQRFLFSDQLITPDGTPQTKRLSDVLLFGSTRAVRSWTIDTLLQYNSESSSIARNTSTVRYSPGPFRTVYGTYRLQRGTSEQFGLGWQWPLSGNAPTLNGSPASDAVRAAQEARAARAAAQVSSSGCGGTLYGVGRVDYDMQNRRWSNALVGVEYDAGCWIGRLVVERQSTSLNSTTTKLMLQLELVGLSRIGQNPLVKLRDNIPGYQLLYDRKNGTALPGLPASEGSPSEVAPRP